jgi:hypothetical protein
MKCRQKIMLGTALCSAALAVFAFLVASREPRFRGHFLTYWLASSGSPDRQQEGSPAEDEVSRAVDAIGTNAIPYLLMWLQAEQESQTQIRLVYLIKRQFPRYRHLWRFDRECMALKGFKLLGTNALSASTSLMRCTTNADYRVRWNALICLEQIGTQKESFVPILVQRLTDPQEVVRFHAARVLHSRFPPEAVAAGVYAVYPSLLAPATNTTTFE